MVPQDKGGYCQLLLWCWWLKWTKSFPTNDHLNLAEIDWPISWRLARWHEEQQRHSWNTPTEACSISPTPTSPPSGGQRRKWKVSDGQNLKIPRGILPFFSSWVLHTCLARWLLYILFWPAWPLWQYSSTSCLWTIIMTKVTSWAVWPIFL